MVLVKIVNDSENVYRSGKIFGTSIIYFAEIAKLLKNRHWCTTLISLSLVFNGIFIFNACYMPKVIIHAVH